ncbi:putative phosphatidylinositol N-acetylglucosaminyltransferase subunit C isoform X3 [Senna tora]|uniref:Putative phosphatidylinositol N-acetylglucosaminyltransferase subunit C isoform X3 n=1 Tax=Senna tora TaxID=362788 RepID=A0A834X7Y1_9FABA|nr:putative phosphatidylinositol N-acetylglucosaminyltransferase subunit C isoform X3 [Senna tora]KAF7839799.1 putative phosphatidylinositol N-acetylglucosaminyltransferase subunit C isoform X3 [Senna tora]
MSDGGQSPFGDRATSRSDVSSQFEFKPQPHRRSRASTRRTRRDDATGSNASSFTDVSHFTRLRAVLGVEMDVVAFQACLAAVSLVCLSRNLRKYGLRRFLFVDRYSGQMACFHDDYVKQISVILLTRMVLRSMFSLLYFATLLALVISWTYVSTISLSASILFHLVCNLQVIHFDDYGKLLERESDVLVFMEEHIRLRYHLSKISHRFIIYLLLEFLVVAASQFVTLLQITVYGGIITFTNGGDFVVNEFVIY